MLRQPHHRALDVSGVKGSPASPARCASPAACAEAGARIMRSTWITSAGAVNGEDSASGAWKDALSIASGELATVYWLRDQPARSQGVSCRMRHSEVHSRSWSATSRRRGHRAWGVLSGLVRNGLSRRIVRVPPDPRLPGDHPEPPPRGSPRSRVPGRAAPGGFPPGRKPRPPGGTSQRPRWARGPRESWRPPGSGHRRARTSRGRPGARPRPFARARARTRTPLPTWPPCADVNACDDWEREKVKVKVKPRWSHREVSRHPRRRDRHDPRDPPRLDDGACRRAARPLV